jgi:hypothetical protein
MTHTDFAEDLRQFDEEFADCELVEKKTFDDVPPGRYQATVDRLLLDHAKTTGNAVLRWELVVATGAHQGQRIFRTNALTTPDNRRWLKTDLATAGLLLDRLSDLPARLEELIDVLLDVTVSVKGTGDEARTNVYLNKRIDRGEPVSSRPTAGATKPGVSRGLSRF